jgi:diacylglycerol kinase
MKNGSTIFDSFHYALEGFWYALRTQRNPRIHLIVAAGVTAAGFYFRLSTVEWAVLVLAMGSVIITETVNTVVEVAVDLVVEEYHVLAKRAKDIAAAAVLMAAMTSVIVGLLLFGPRILAMLGR